jgi:phospholipid-binding lipoprotein MlaA
MEVSLSSVRRRCGHLLAAAAMALSAGCATTNGDSRDPFEGFNRAMYEFNQVVDKAVLKPVSQAYKDTLPELVQTGVRNFFANLGDLFIAVNNLLQGKVVNAASDGMRLVINTTIGGLGVMDWATEIGLEKHNEDFGQTFGRWGVGDGPYIVWPIFGSSTVRDSIGEALDIRFDPVRNHTPVDVRNVALLTRMVVRRADLLDASRILEEAALDKYIFQRDSYLQRRRSLIFDGDPPREFPRASTTGPTSKAEDGGVSKAAGIGAGEAERASRAPENEKAEPSASAQGD